MEVRKWKMENGIMENGEIENRKWEFI